MNLYVALGIIEYEGYTILGIYSTREAAEKRIEEDTTGYDDYSVEETTLDTGEVVY